MTLTLESRELGKQIKIHEVHDLELTECRQFHTELVMMIQSMDDTIMEAVRLYNDAGVPFDQNWMHRTRMKRRIAISFATEAKRRLAKLEGVEGHGVRRKQTLHEVQRDWFVRAKQARMRELLTEELGPGVYEELDNEAHEAAEERFKAWLSEHGHEQLYVT
jgi:ligand-binding sensor domain-containing protein